MHDVNAEPSRPDVAMTREPPAPKPTTTGALALVIARTLDEAGFSGEQALRSVGIASQLSNDPMSRVPVSTMSALYATCVDLTGDPCFGLAVGRSINLTHMHALGHALATSATLMEFCQRLQRFWTLMSDGSAIELVECGDELSLGVRRFSDPCAQAEDAFLAFLVLAMRQLYKPSFNPLRVGFRHPVPVAGGRLYAELFLAPVVFDQARPTLTFRQSDMEQPLPGASAELARLNEALALRYLVQLDKGDILAAVRQQIVQLLPNGRCSRVAVARMLHISPSTLQSRLARHGASYLGLLDAIRKELAHSYLQQPSLSMTEITFLLGFGNVSNFTRAFKRWHGVPPTQFRAGADSADT